MASIRRLSNPKFLAAILIGLGIGYFAFGSVIVGAVLGVILGYFAERM